MTRAFVLSGGASLGAVQVGMLRALAERGIHPDLVVGASAGAINAAWVAGDPHLEDLDGLERIWLCLRTRDVFPAHPLRGLLGFLGRRQSLVSNQPLRARGSPSSPPTAASHARSLRSSWIRQG